MKIVQTIIDLLLTTEVV